MIIKLQVDRFENNNAVLTTEDGQTILWPKNKLPPTAKEGVALFFTIFSNGGSDKENEFEKKLAKEILNELLNTSKE